MQHGVFEEDEGGADAEDAFLIFLSSFSLVFSFPFFFFFLFSLTDRADIGFTSPCLSPLYVVVVGSVYKGNLSSRSLGQREITRGKFLFFSRKIYSH